MGVKQDVVLEQLFFVVLPLLVLLNVFFSLKGIMSQLKCSKKILYSALRKNWRKMPFNIEVKSIGNSPAIY